MFLPNDSSVNSSAQVEEGPYGAEDELNEEPRYHMELLADVHLKYPLISTEGLLQPTPGANFMSQKFRVKFLKVEFLRTVNETPPFFLPGSKFCSTSELRVNLSSAKKCKKSQLKFRAIMPGGNFLLTFNS